MLLERLRKATWPPLDEIEGVWPPALAAVPGSPFTWVASDTMPVDRSQTKTSTFPFASAKPKSVALLWKATCAASELMTAFKEDALAVLLAPEIAWLTRVMFPV